MAAILLACKAAVLLDTFASKATSIPFLYVFFPLLLTFFLQLQNDETDVRKELERLQHNNAELRTEVERLRQENLELKARLEKLQLDHQLTKS